MSNLWSLVSGSSDDVIPAEAWGHGHNKMQVRGDRRRSVGVALQDSTLSQMSSTSGQATASRCETEFSVPVAAHGATSPAPGSALADDSPNVLSGRDRGFYDPDPPSPETVRQAWLWEMGLAQ